MFPIFNFHGPTDSQIARLASEAREIVALRRGRRVDRRFGVHRRRGGRIQTVHIQDGLGLVLWRRAGLKPAGSRPGRRRRRNCGRANSKFDFLIQQKDRFSKVAAVEKLLAREKSSWDEVCFVGDDIVDLGPCNAQAWRWPWPTRCAKRRRRAPGHAHRRRPRRGARSRGTDFESAEKVEPFSWRIIRNEIQNPKFDGRKRPEIRRPKGNREPKTSFSAFGLRNSFRVSGFGFRDLPLSGWPRVPPCRWPSCWAFAPSKAGARLISPPRILRTAASATNQIRPVRRRGTAAIRRTAHHQNNSNSERSISTASSK